MSNKANIGTLQKHDIVFSSPFYGVDNGHYYGKTQEGIVFLHFICKKDALGLTTGNTFAVLPEGFRPAVTETYASYVSGTAGGGRQPGVVGVYANGTINFITLSGITYTSMNYIDFSCLFPV